jgi:hypothetical protein
MDLEIPDTVPVKVGEAIGAFNEMSVVFEAILVVLVFILVVKEDKSVTSAFNANPGTVGASAVPPKSPAN